MAFEHLKKFATGLRPAELAIAQLIAVMTVILFAPAAPVPVSGPVVGFTEMDEAAFAVARPDGSIWRAVDAYEVPVPRGAAWIDWTVPSEALDRGTPLALSTQGPFSATVYFNGKKSGKKAPLPAPQRKKELAPSMRRSPFRRV